MGLGQHAATYSQFLSGWTPPNSPALAAIVWRHQPWRNVVDVRRRTLDALGEQAGLAWYL